MMATRADSLATGTVEAAEEALRGFPRPFRILPFLGPAFVACVAYIDPGNFATNIAGGAKFGYTLCWVIVVANLMAMLIQTLSAKLGIATGRNLPELCREQFPRRAVVRPVDPGRADRDGHRPRRVPRRGARVPPALRLARCSRRRSSPAYARS